jgi:protein TonB
MVPVAYFGGKRRAGAAITSQDSGLALRVERSAGELLLTWNRDSAPIKNAGRAVLEISDGTQHENVQMDLAQLRNGTIVYSPVTADVVFRMDIMSADQKQLANESVRVLRTRPSPLTPDAPQTPPASTAAVAPAVTAPAAPAASEPAPEEESKPVGPPRVTKPFNTESLSRRLRPATATDLPDAPAAVREASAVPSMPAGLSSVPSAVAAPPPPAAEKASTPLGGQIESARLVSRKDPEYPKMARDAGAKGTVKLIATVGTDGRVLRVKAVSGHPLLIRPATEAVMEWVYRPTYLNGVPIETQTDITLNFVNDR